jgi:hypothetical protein
MKIYGGSEGIAPPLTLALDGGEWSAYAMAALPLREIPPPGTQ